MEPQEKAAYYKGYVAGYRDGMRDAANGKVIKLDVALVEDLPVQGTTLSTRAKNCLLFSGCKTIRDAASLSAERIATIRSMGPKTAGEIARYFDSLGIRFTNWNTYL